MLTARLDRTTARAAIALATRAPSVHNSQPWRWRIGSSSIHLFAHPERALPATDPDGRGLLVSCGAALHHLRVALRATGLDSEVHRLPDPGAPTHLAAVEPFERPPTPDDLALAAAIDRRRSDRRMYSSWPVPAAHLDEMTRAARAEGAVLRVLERESQRWAVARLVERAALEQALTPGLAQETAAWTGRGRGADDGVPAAAVPVQPDGTVPMRHFAGGELGQTALGREESDGTVLAILSTDHDDAPDRLRAGEALSAVLLTATRIGLATDAISQPLEVATTRADLREACLDGAGEPQLLIRIGWIPISTDVPPATGRRPVDDTIDDLEQPWD